MYSKIFLNTNFWDLSPCSPVLDGQIISSSSSSPHKIHVLGVIVNIITNTNIQTHKIYKNTVWIFRGPSEDPRDRNRQDGETSKLHWTELHGGERWSGVKVFTSLPWTVFVFVFVFVFIFVFVKRGSSIELHCGLVESGDQVLRIDVQITTCLYMYLGISKTMMQRPKYWQDRILLHQQILKRDYKICNKIWCDSFGFTQAWLCFGILTALYLYLYLHFYLYLYL